MAGLELVGVTKKRGDITVVDGVDLAVQDGEFVAVLAPPGHGKTTLLRLIAGLEAPDAGDIILDDVSIVDRPVQTRGIGMVFEDLAVFPHWSGFDNLAHPLKIARVDQDEIAERVSEVASMLGVPLGTVLARLHRGRKLFEKAMWDYAAEQGLLEEGQR
jgi:ABC-type sugar transport system ATPase subunit